MVTAQLRASAPLFPTHPLVGPPPPTLGPLQELPGNWVGSGFNIIFLPDFQGHLPFRVLTNRTHENLEFTAIGAPVPNRGSAQDDIEFLGVHYLQRVSDFFTNAGLHIEPGIWLNVPATNQPPQPPVVVRQSTIPHGDSLLAQGSFFTAPAPLISPVSSTPVSTSGQAFPLGYLDPLLTAVPPDGIPQAAIANPNIVLQNAINGQNIIETVVLEISTTPVGGIVNMPFVTTNANATRMSAIFWIETVKNKDGRDFMQLQYTQTVILNFLGIDWPHISVATLVKH